MNEILMPDYMREIKHKQVSAVLSKSKTEQESILGEALIRAVAFDAWKKFIRELAIQVEQCQNLEGIGKSSLSPTRESETGPTELRITICGSGPLAVAKICVLRFCESGQELPYIHCLCQDGMRDDFRITFCVDKKGKVILLTSGPATPIQAASYVMEPIVRSLVVS